MKITDWRGVEIKVGDVVVYPGRQSSSMWMVEAVVEELIPGNPEAKVWYDRVPHGVKVRRQRTSEWNGADIAHKQVTVQADRTTVVPSVEEG